MNIKLAGVYTNSTLFSNTQANVRAGGMSVENYVDGVFRVVNPDHVRVKSRGTLIIIKVMVFYMELV